MVSISTTLLSADWLKYEREIASMAEDKRDKVVPQLEAIQQIMFEIIEKFYDLQSELKVGRFIVRKYEKMLVIIVADGDFKKNFQFTNVGEGGYGVCFKVSPKENAPENLACCGEFLAKKLKESTDQQELVEETACMLLLTQLGHYGIIESHVVKYKMEEGPSLLFVSDSSGNVTPYITMKYIEGRQLSEALENKELNAYDKLRIAVRIADTMNFLHGYKLAHCDLSCENIMLARETNNPILIDFGSVRTAEGFSLFDTSSYHAMIYRMYRDCDVRQIPSVLRPIFDKWDDEIHCQMSFKDITDKYLSNLSVYHAMVSFVEGQESNIIPVKRYNYGIMRGLIMIDFIAMSKSSSFTEYMNEAGISLAEQDKKIAEYLKSENL